MKKKLSEPTRPPRAIGYTRVSTEEQETSPELQRNSIQAKADQLGVPVLFVNDTQSGKVVFDDRKELRNAIELAESGDLFIVYCMDRLGRNDTTIPVVRQLLRLKGVSLISCAGEGDEETPEGRFIRTMFAAIATFEGDRISQRIKRNAELRKSQGLTVGNTPYGFRREGDRFVPDEVEQSLIRRIQILKLSMTFEGIVDCLNIEGVQLRGKTMDYKKVRTLYNLKLTNCEPIQNNAN